MLGGSLRGLEEWSSNRKSRRMDLKSVTVGVTGGSKKHYIDKID